VKSEIEKEIKSEELDKKIDLTGFLLVPELFVEGQPARYI
jgi:hypothetical protein